tara:strand:+ start:1119 stop:1274 length:156 start_codon:yes stop_codon:yes gene_type:complete
MQVDEITGLEFPVTTNRLVLGAEMLGGCVLIAGISFGASFAFKGKKSKKTN